MIHLLWGSVLFVGSIFILVILMKNRNRSVFLYFFLIWILCGIVLGVINIIFQRYDAYCSMYLGVVSSCYTFYDNRQYPVSKKTNAYISSLQGNVAGMGLLLYGILSLCYL